MRKATIPKVSLTNICLSPFAGNTKLSRMLEGKFTDDSTSENWWYKANKWSGEKIDISAHVNPSTKKFKIRPIQCTPFFYLNGKLETVKIADNTGDVQSLYRLMFNCSQLLSVDLQGMNTQNVTNMKSVFAGCSSLISLDLSSFDTSKVTSMNQMFNNCRALTTLNLSGFNANNAMDMSAMFDLCSSLTTVVGPVSGLKQNLDLHWSPLTTDSAMVFINGLATVALANTIKFKKSTYDSLTPEQIAVATSKGWTVASV